MVSVEFFIDIILPAAL